MKKIISVILAAAIVCALSACSDGSGSKPASNVSGKTQGVNDVLSSAAAQQNTQAQTIIQAKTTKAAGNASAANGEYDVDLTQLNSTMVYSEVYNMTTNPGSYLGKKVKMRGPFSVYEDESTGKRYYACLISDATACCAKGIEFDLTKELKYPDEYPEVGTEITVTGIFGTYQEGESTYCVLNNAEMI